MDETRTPCFETLGLAGSKTGTPKKSSNHCSLHAASSPDPASAPACPQERAMPVFQRPVTQTTMGLLKAKTRSRIIVRAWSS
jgi:hypothetical protein